MAHKQSKLRLVSSAPQLDPEICTPDSSSQSEMTAEEPSISERLTQIKRNVLQAAAKRERLPQPLFWSLFHAELDEIRKQKKLERAVSSVLE